MTDNSKMSSLIFFIAHHFLLFLFNTFVKSLVKSIIASLTFAVLFFGLLALAVVHRVAVLSLLHKCRSTVWIQQAKLSIFNHECQRGVFLEHFLVGELLENLL